MAAQKTRRTQKIKQAPLLATWAKDRFAFGGAKLKNSHAKKKRPFNRKLPLHVVMRSSQAKGSKSLLNFGREVEAVLFEEAAKHSIKLHAAANAGNHLHLLVQAHSRYHFSDFLRAISGRIAMIVTGARKGASLVDQIKKTSVTVQHPSETNASARFWDQRPFTRLVSMGKDFMGVLRYIALNSTEVAGFTRERARRMFAEIRERIRLRQIPVTPSLRAAGFV